ncbi:hypothetical protein [Acinetobacter venetianus]|uniref:hypothetical protein n=1 Tax=Acinetobacter venetianus TaxID=52133 RepID=UPI000775B795|nr:hypothetical protein [Acinetobacter venetianus]KXO82851.1 hypothetical protein AYL20_02350 [Acinetobacter venetianus]
MNILQICNQLNHIIHLMNDLSFINLKLSIVPVPVANENIWWYKNDPYFDKNSQTTLYLFKHNNRVFLLRNKDLGMGCCGLIHIKIENLVEFYSEILTEHLNCFLDYKEIESYSIYNLNNHDQNIINNYNDMTSTKISILAKVSAYSDPNDWYTNLYKDFLEEYLYISNLKTKIDKRIKQQYMSSLKDLLASSSIININNMIFKSINQHEYIKELDMFLIRFNRLL